MVSSGKYILLKRLVLSLIRKSPIFKTQGIDGTNVHACVYNQSPMRCCYTTGVGWLFILCWVFGDTSY